jgi:ribosomal protein S18 acetylase RimI-like enzyme
MAMLDAIGIRPLIEADAATYWQIRLRMLREHPDAFGASYEESLKLSSAEVAQQFRARALGPEATILGAIAGGLVGVVGCMRERRPKERHKAFVWGMYVAPEARQRGIGRALMFSAVECARSWPGVEQLRLAVVTANEPARRLYQSLGFVVYGVEPGALKLGDSYYDEALMTLHLTHATPSLSG